MLELLVTVSLLLGHMCTAVCAIQDLCYDVDGNHVPLGGGYYDGEDWRICGQLDEDGEATGFMEQKWRKIFKVLDLNYDGTLTKDDIKISKEKYVRKFTSYGIQMDEIRTSVDKFWHCILIDTYRFPPKISENRFLASYRKAFQTHRANGVKRLNICKDHLLNIIDIDKDGFLSFEELFEEYNMWNKGNEQLVRDVFNLMGPNDADLVSNENYKKYYDELFYGVSKEHFQNVIDVYRAAGVSF